MKHTTLLIIAMVCALISRATSSDSCAFLQLRGNITSTQTFAGDAFIGLDAKKNAKPLVSMYFFCKPFEDTDEGSEAANPDFVTVLRLGKSLWAKEHLCLSGWIMAGRCADDLLAGVGTRLYYADNRLRATATYEYGTSYFSNYILQFDYAFQKKFLAGFMADKYFGYGPRLGISSSKDEACFMFHVGILQSPDNKYSLNLSFAADIR